MKDNFIVLTDATTGEYILLNTTLISRAYKNRASFGGKERTVTRIDFIDDKPSEWVEESVFEIYKKI